MVDRKEVCEHLNHEPRGRGITTLDRQEKLRYLTALPQEPEGTERLASSMELQARAPITSIRYLSQDWGVNAMASGCLGRHMLLGIITEPMGHLRLVLSHGRDKGSQAKVKLAPRDGTWEPQTL